MCSVSTILTQEEDDPIRVVYQEQLKYIAEKNWGNEVKKLRLTYGITETDQEIATYSKESWKNLVKKKTRLYSNEILNTELKELKQGSKLGPYVELKTQEYIESFMPQKARKLFHVRAGIIDLKTVRKYWYTDRQCRLCQNGEEDVEHVVNSCYKIPRSCTIDNILTNDVVEMEHIADCCLIFATKLKELDKDSAAARGN